MSLICSSTYSAALLLIALLLVPVSSLVVFGALVHGGCLCSQWAVASSKPDVLFNGIIIKSCFKPWVPQPLSAPLVRWLTGHTVLSFLNMAHQGDHCSDFTHCIGVIPLHCACWSAHCPAHCFAHCAVHCSVHCYAHLLIALLTAVCLIALIIATCILIGSLLCSLCCYLLCSLLCSSALCVAHCGACCSAQWPACCLAHCSAYAHLVCHLLGSLHCL